ncbi:NAD-binding protein, partial [Candidatus Roizmanbacteria bacterium]|nr:NAD-binding protein [Candidatus Roizmanbacteria bacterium]
LFVIIFIFLIIAISASFDIPVLIGAFIAGVLVSQSIEHYHIFSQIRPLRDLMAIVFFVFIGTHIQAQQAVVYIPQILLFSAFLIGAKMLVLLLVFLYFRFSTRMAFSLAVFLFQASENAFILLTLAFTNKIFTQEQYLFLISSVLLSLMLTPILINSKDAMYDVIRGFFKRYVPAIELFIKHRLDFDQSPLDVFDLKNHVVICGYGRIGSQVGKALSLANIPFIAIDYNFHTIEKAKKDGVTAIYGDPTDFDVLDFAEVEHASALVSAVPSKFDQERVVLNAKKLNPKIVLISRVHNEKDRQRMKDLGVHAVVSPEIEASLSIVRKIFMLKRMSQDDIVRRIRHIKLVQGVI